MKQLFFIFLFLFLPFRGAAAFLPEIVARFGTVELKKERFQRFDLPASPAERKATLKKLVDTEIYLIIVRRLLERSGIAPDAVTARRYVEMRKKKFSSSPQTGFFKTLDASINKPEFQLKCALYFTFYAADPATVEPTSDEIRQHYYLNREKFRLPVKSELALFRAGAKDPTGKKQSEVILARLRQGEDFYALAKQSDPKGRGKNTTPDPELRPYFKKVKEIPAGSWGAVETPKGIYIVKVLSRSAGSYRSFEETEPYITEMLSSARLKNSLEQYMREIIAKNPVRYFF